MDPFAILAIRSSIDDSAQLLEFDSIFQSYFPGDPDGSMRNEESV